jgi:hypothetical protein
MLQSDTVMSTCSVTGDREVSEDVIHGSVKSDVSEVVPIDYFNGDVFGVMLCLHACCMFDMIGLKDAIKATNS